MNLFSLQKIRERFLSFKSSEWYENDHELNKSKAFLASLPEPNTLEQRSYNQYLCQRFLYQGPLLAWIENLTARLCFPFLKKRLLATTIEPANVTFERPTAIFFNPLGVSLLPHELQAQYQILFLPKENNMCLLPEDVEFVDALKRQYPCDPFFVFKIMCRVAAYRAYMEKYKPAAIIATAEYSFTSSVLTQFCRLNHVAHINVEHGEKWFCLTSTFFEFDRCYVWDEHYINLFKTLRTAKTQFLVSVPDSVMMKLEGFAEKVDFKYYMQIDKKPVLLKLKKIVDNLTQQGYSVVLRPHPRYCNEERVRRMFPGVAIESAHEVPIAQSLGETRNVVGFCSAVLFQAYMSGKAVVVDNVTSPQQFEMLCKNQYLLLTKSDVRLLSESLKANVVKREDVPIL